MTRAIAERSRVDRTRNAQMRCTRQVQSRSSRRQYQRSKYCSSAIITTTRASKSASARALGNSSPASISDVSKKARPAKESCSALAYWAVASTCVRNERRGATSCRSYSCSIVAVGHLIFFSPIRGSPFVALFNTFQTARFRASQQSLDRFIAQAKRFLPRNTQRGFATIRNGAWTDAPGRRVRFGDR